jgi:hypothetical protein|nr:MAG TPA: hypothetical protein [Bacteriophage sp.]
MSLNNDILSASKRIPVRHNVSMNVIDLKTRQVVSTHTGHNASTNGLLTGIGHYLTGDGILNQGWSLLNQYVPKYISLGTMGLINQDEDENGYPAGIGVVDGTEEKRFIDYMVQCPSFGADGYDKNLNNNRKYLGLGPMYSNRPGTGTVNCELITPSYMRSEISFRDVVPETESEIPRTIDVVFSALIPLGNLSKFREEGSDHIFITEAGLWSRKDWVDGGDNGLLAGYRIAPPDEENWDMHKLENRDLLRKEVIRVGVNQVVQVIWKIQLGGIEQLGGINKLYPDEFESRLRWICW